MGKVIVSVALSVDGFAEGAGGDLSVMPLDETFSIHNAELIRDAETLLYGGTTYRQMLGYWPHVLDEPSSSEADREIATKIAGGMPLIAVSDSLTPTDTGPWSGQTRIVGRDEVASVVEELRGHPGDTVVFGSATTWTALLSAGLVDELYLMIGPKIVSGDSPAFRGAPSTQLRLLEVRQREGSQNVVLHYSVEH